MVFLELSCDFLCAFKCVGAYDILSLIMNHVRNEFVICLILLYYPSYVTWIETTFAYSMDSLSCACLEQERSKLGGF